MQKIELFNEYNNINREIIKYSVECKKQELDKINRIDSKKKNITPSSSDESDNTQILEICDISNSSNEEDPQQKVLLWSINIETVFKEWRIQSCNRSDKHKYHNFKFRIMFIVFSTINIILPIISAFVTNNIQNSYLIFSLIMLFNSIVSSLMTFIDPSKKAEQHRQFMNLYEEFVNDINIELVKPLNSRTPAELFMQKSLDRFNHLNSISPDT
jgi:hypothetical protein